MVYFWLEWDRKYARFHFNTVAGTQVEWKLSDRRSRSAGGGGTQQRPTFQTLKIHSSLVFHNFPLKFSQNLLCLLHSLWVKLQLDRSSNKGIRANSAPAGPILTRPAPNENLDKSRTLYNSSNDRRAKNGLKITVGPVFQELWIFKVWKVGRCCVRCGKIEIFFDL